MVVDDHPMLRDAVVRSLRASGIDVVGECSSGPEALVRYGVLLPDIVTCDLNLGAGKMTGIAVVSSLRATYPDARVIIFSAHNEQGDVDAALDAGAVGYVDKLVDSPELIECIRQAHEGQYVFDKKTAASVISSLRGRDGADKVRLSPRELEVLKLMMQGVTSTKAIAATLFISSVTAKTHCERLMFKLGVSDRAQAVAKAYREHIIAV